jgi:pimeloyl-ACP methyl ester carboxylesterase
MGPEQSGDGVRHGGFRTTNAELPDTWTWVPTISSDAGFVTAARRFFPDYFPDHRGREEQFAPILASVGGSYTFGLDDCVAVSVDDQDRLGSIRIPTLGILSRHDFICGSRWAREIHERIPGPALVVLDNSGPCVGLPTRLSEGEAVGQLEAVAPQQLGIGE